jgi:hypothetical protein
MLTGKQPPGNQAVTGELIILIILSTPRTESVIPVGGISALVANLEY